MADVCNGNILREAFLSTPAINSMKRRVYSEYIQKTENLRNSQRFVRTLITMHIASFIINFYSYEILDAAYEHFKIAC